MASVAVLSSCLVVPKWELSMRRSGRRRDDSNSNEEERRQRAWNLGLTSLMTISLICLSLWREKGRWGRGKGGEGRGRDASCRLHFLLDLVSSPLCTLERRAWTLESE